MTATVNACVPPARTLAVAGDTVTAIPAVTVTNDVPGRPASRTEAAVTVTVAGDGTLAGAV